jgi:alpha-galactosidase
MRQITLAALFCIVLYAPAQQPGPTQKLAVTPPMGWNSWDSYGATIDEAQFRSSAAWVAEHLKASGYQYVTIDAEWFEADPIAEGNKKNGHLQLDSSGRYTPALNRFPTAANGAGFAPLAAYVHSLGLKFGIHVLQGIPKEAVAQNYPVEGSAFHARDAANVAAGCQWNSDNYDLAVTPAGQAYYDSIVRMYASWNVDLIKIDCIASRPYKGDEIRMFHEAILKTGRPILLSLSPGEVPFDEASNLARYSQQWRISDDTWDLWHSTAPYPQGVNDQFPRAAKWVSAQSQDAAGGHWPDADMLPFGRLGPAPGWGNARDSHLTHDEQRTLFNLWCMMRSPLMYGGDPAATDDWTLALLTNRAVLDVDQHSHNNKSAMLTDALAVWTADGASKSDHYVAVFNRLDTPQTIHLEWQSLGLNWHSYQVHDLWTRYIANDRTAIDVTLPPHGSSLMLAMDMPKQVKMVAKPR